MIGPREAMDAITAHLATKGIETGRSVTWLEGSAPIMVTIPSLGPGVGGAPAGAGVLAQRVGPPRCAHSSILLICSS